MNELIPLNSIVVTDKRSLRDASWTFLVGSYGAAVLVTSQGELSLSYSELHANNVSGFGGAIFNEGSLTLAESVVFTANTATWGGGAVCSKKDLTITGGMFSGNKANTGGAIEAWATSDISDASFSCNSATYGGALKIGSGKTVLSHAVFSQNTAQLGGAVLNYGEAVLTDVSFNDNSGIDGGAICNYEESTATLENVSFLTASDTISNYGTMVFKGTISLAGALTTASAIKATGVSLVFDISRYSTGSTTAIVGNLTQLTGVKDYSLKVADNQAAGTYALAGNASALGKKLVMKCDGFAAKTLALGETYTYHGGVYQWQMNGGNASVSVEAFAQSSSADALSWGAINGAESYMLELGNAQLEVATQGVDLLGLANGDYAWRVRNAVEADNWQDGEAFTQTEAPEGPQKLEAVTNDAADLFFAHADGVWGSGFMAQHVGNKGGWAGTGESVELAGKARVTDIFVGSEDASILKLALQAQNEVPEAQASGVALFLDDIYSASPVPEAQASGRLSQINTILATEGADIIDLTSQCFDFVGGVTVHGGAGDDVIWANSGENTLFGGDGDDRIIGGSGDDVICGGTGNDALHGGGGNDIFCFGENWGQDTVSQLNGDKVTLWFSGSQEELQLSFKAMGSDTLITATTGDSIRASGMSVSLADCRFGAAGHETEYDTLASSGVFA